MTVCIVDDNTVVAAQLKRMLDQVGIVGSHAFTDSRQALSWCLATPPDLILLDYNMPDLDGIEFLGELHRHQATQRVPVAMISGWAVESMRLVALRAGAIDVISKPFSPEEVKLKVLNLLRMNDRHPSMPRTSQANEAQRQPDPATDPDEAVVMMLERLAAIRADRPAASMRRIGAFAARIGACYGLNEREQALLARAAPLHDIGNWSVPSEVLARSAPVTTEGRRQLDGRTSAGHQVLSNSRSPVLQLAAEIALSSLEHWDGSGAPNGLRGEAIPLSGRIVALADMFEQMTGWRAPNRSALSADSAAAVIHADEGPQFDPGVVRAFDQALPSLRTLMEPQHQDALCWHRAAVPAH